MARTKCTQRNTVPRVKAANKKKMKRQAVEALPTTPTVLARCIEAHKGGAWSPLGLVLSQLNLEQLAIVAQTTPVLNTFAKEDDCLWKPLYQKRWPNDMIGCAGSSPTRNDYRKRYISETGLFEHCQPDRFDIILSVKVDRFPIFQGQCTITIDSDDAPEIEIENQCDESSVMRTIGKYDGELWEGVSATLSIHRHSDGAIACVYQNAPLNEESMNCFGGGKYDYSSDYLGTDLGSMSDFSGTWASSKFWLIASLVDFEDEEDDMSKLNFPGTATIEPELSMSSEHDDYGSHDKAFVFGKWSASNMGQYTFRQALDHLEWAV